MHRRQFLSTSLAASAFALAAEGSAQPASQREFYQLRRYNLKSGPQTKLTEEYFSGALMPALARLGMGPIGAFTLTYGEQTPAYYLLIPSPSADALTRLDLTLSKDEAFLAAAAPFWDATAASPSLQRIEIALLAAFEGWPRVTPPPAAASKGKRIFQLRTYESPSNGEHVRKVEMFHSGEFEIFVKAGFHPVFFGDALTGPRLPNLTYMLSMESLTALDDHWNAFRNDPDWKKLSTNPRYAYDQIVTNISNLLLSPLDCSQI
jgi:hypothetical protein